MPSKKATILKQLLTTTSAIVVLAGGVENALAAVVDVNASANIMNGSNDAGNLSAPFNSGNDSLRLTGGYDITSGGDITLVAPGVNINGNNGQTFNVGHVVNYGANPLVMNLNVTAGRFSGTAATNVTGAVTVNSPDATGTTVGNVSAGVTATAGILNMRGLTGGAMSIGTATVAATDPLNGSITFTDSGALNLNGNCIINGNINFANNAATVTFGIHRTITGSIDSTGGSNGVLIFIGPSFVEYAIGATNPITAIYSQGNGLHLRSTVTAQTIVVGTGALTAEGLITSAGAGISFTGAGPLTANKGIIGNVALSHSSNVVVINAPLTGDVTSPGTGTLSATHGITGNVTATNNTQITVTGGNVTGALTLNGASKFTGATSNIGGLVTINSTGAASNIQDAAAGVVATKGTLNMRALTGGAMSIGTATVTASGLVTGNVAFTADGSFTANGGVTGNVDFAGNAGTFTVGNNGTITGTVDSTGASNGTLNFSGAGGVTGAIGATYALAAINFNGPGVVALGSTVRAQSIVISSATVTASGLVTGNVAFTAGGSLTANGGITGAVDFAGKAGTVNVAATKTITGTVDSTGSPNGTLNFAGGGGVTGAIGATYALAAINFNGPGVVALGSTVRAQSIVISSATVTASGLITAANGITFTGAGLLNADGGVTGNIDFAGKAGTVAVGNNKVITGTINSTGSANGTLVFAGSADVTGDIGASNPLAAINFNGAGAVNLGGVVRSNAALTIANAGTAVTASGLVTGNVAFTADGSFAANGGVTGNVDFAGNAGTFTVGNNGTITGTVDSTGASNGTLNFSGAGGVTGAIGATNKLTVINFNGAGAVNLGGVNAVNAAKLVVKGGAVVTAGGLITATGAGVSFAAGGGTLNANNGFTGKVALDNGGTVVVANAPLTGDVTSPDSGNLSVTHGITGDVTLANNSSVIVTGGDVGQNLDLTGMGRLTGITADVGGTVTVNTNDTIIGSTIQDANGAVTITAGKLTMRNAKNNVIVDGATSTGFVNDVVGNITLANNGTLTVKGNIDGKTNGAGTLIFDNNGGVTQTVTGKVGDMTPITSIKFTDNDVTFVSNILGAVGLDFTAASGVTVTTAGSDLGATNITGASSDNTLIVTGNQTLTGNIANFGNIQGSGVSTIEINTTNFLAGITAGAADEVTAKISQDNLTITNLGKPAARLLDVQFNGDNTTVNSIYTKTATIDVGKKVTFGGPLVAGNLTLAGAGSIAEFADEAVMDSVVIPTIAGQGIVNFAGSAEVKKAIGNVAAINFNGDDNPRSKQIKLFDNMAAKANFKKARVILQNNIDMSAGASFAGSTIELGDKALTISNGDITFTGEVRVNTDIKIGAHGNIVLDAGAHNIDLSGITTLIVHVNDSAVGSLSGANTYTLLSTTTGTIVPFDSSKIVIDNTGSVNHWSVAYLPDGTITISEDVTASPPPSSGNPPPSSGGSQLPSNPPILSPGNSVSPPIISAPPVGLGHLHVPEELVPGTIIQMFDNVTPDSAAAGFIQELKSMSASDQKDATVRLANATNNADTIIDSINDVTDQMTSRAQSAISSIGMGAFSSDFLVSYDDNESVSGVAAGDEAAHHGVWTSAFYSENTQKSLGIAFAGHKATSSGLTIGLDTKVTETMALGGAATFIGTKVNYKDYKSGDKTLIDSKILTLYGVNQIFDNMYLQGIVNFASSTIRNSDIRGAGNNKQIAKGKYTSKIFSSELTSGYNYVISKQLMLTPIAGLSYMYIGSNNYKEQGTANQNLSVKTGASYKIGGVVGIRATFEPYKTGNLLLSPEVHAYFRQDLRAKNPKVEVRLDGINNNLAREVTKTTRRFINIGTILSAKYGRADYGFGYDATFSNKYIGHQGTLKLRIEF